MRPGLDAHHDMLPSCPCVASPWEATRLRLGVWGCCRTHAQQSGFGSESWFYLSWGMRLQTLPGEK